jgi:hypothetical protein
MAENKEWLDWINDQIKDMHSDEGYADNGKNRVFKTTEDDRDIALHLLKTLKDIIEKDENIK